MKKYLLSPLFAPIFSILFLTILGLIGYLFYTGQDPAFFEPGHFCDFLTYSFYGLALLVALFCISDFKDNKLSYFCFIFLWFCALMREMGVQHWLTTTDSTAFKIRFFTNPNNPISDKILAGSILIGVVFVVLYLICKYVPAIWNGFWQKKGLYWTVVTFGGLGVLSKIADRFPSHFHKATGDFVSSYSAFWLYLVEEGGEALLPVLFIIALLQYHIKAKELS